MTETKLRLSKSRVSAKVRSVTPLGGGLTAMTGAQFEIRIDGTARTRPKGLRIGGGAVPQEQASAQHGRGQRRRRYRGGSQQVRLIEMGLEGIVSQRLGFALSSGPLAGLAQVQEPECAGGEAGGGRGLGTVTKLRSHFKYNIFMLDEAGELLEHLGGTEDCLLAAELYEVTLKRWPAARIQMRQGARIVYDSMRGATL